MILRGTVCRPNSISVVADLSYLYLAYCQYVFTGLLHFFAFSVFNQDKGCHTPTEA